LITVKSLPSYLSDLYKKQGKQECSSANIDCNILQKKETYGRKGANTKAIGSAWQRYDRQKESGRTVEHKPSYIV